MERSEYTLNYDFVEEEIIKNSKKEMKEIRKENKKKRTKRR